MTALRSRIEPAELLYGRLLASVAENSLTGMATKPKETVRLAMDRAAMPCLLPRFSSLP